MKTPIKTMTHSAGFPPSHWPRRAAVHWPWLDDSDYAPPPFLGLFPVEHWRFIPVLQLNPWGFDHLNGDFS